MKPRNENIEKLRYIVPETYIIGDLGGVKDLGNAIHGGFNRAVEV
jgi:hypothetical protein